MVDRITSVHNPRVKDAARLRDRRGRDEQQRIVIDGPREIMRAIDAGVEVIEVFATLAQLNESEEQALQHATARNIQVIDVAPPVFHKLGYGDRDRGLVAVAIPPQRRLQDLNVADDALVAVLENVEKPGNVGAVVRTADAARVAAVIVADPATDLFNPNAIRASAGTIFSLPVVAESSSAVIEWLRSKSFQIVAARVDANTQFWDVSFRKRTAVVLGSEAAGLSKVWNGPEILPVVIPQHGQADSLNVSVTAAVLFYEALRQRSS